MTITTEENYHKALSMLEKVFDADAGTDEYLLLTLLEDFIAEYEDEHYPVEECSAQEAVAIIMREHKLNKKEFAKSTGIAPSRVSEFMNGTRALSVTQAKAINEKYKISLDILLNAPCKNLSSGETGSIDSLIHKYKQPAPPQYSFQDFITDEVIFSCGSSASELALTA